MMERTPGILQRTAVPDDGLLAALSPVSPTLGSVTVASRPAPPSNGSETLVSEAEVAPDLSNVSLEVKQAALVELLRRNRPARFFVPNWGQEKAFLPFKDYAGHYPASEKPNIVVFTGGNGVGKTTMMVSVLVGCIWGKQELHSFFKDWKIFDEMETVRKKERRPLRLRIVCDKGGMEPGGPILESILQWWPKGLYKMEKNHASFFSQIECYKELPEGGRELVAQVQVKTFHQDPVAHAGATLDGVFTDEPMPRELYAETIGRLRTKGSGFLAMFCTPLEVGGWIKDYLAKEADGQRIVFTSASIWDNCADWHPEPELRGRTRGHLSRKTIEFQIREWKKEGPEIARARELGEFVSLAGALFKEFNEIHIVDSFKIPREWPVYCTMDPHDGKPSFVAWSALSPEGELYFFAEYPYDQEWERVSGGGSVAATCNAIRRIEQSFARQVVYRLGDPVKLGMVYSNSQTNLQQEYARAGYRFALADNQVEVGLSRIRELLAWDPNPDRVDDPMNRPRMFFMRENPYTRIPNRNMICAMQNITYKKGASSHDSTVSMGKLIQDQWKDPVDAIRYTVMGLRPWRPVSAMGAAFESIRDRRAFIKRAARPWD